MKLYISSENRSVLYFGKDKQPMFISIGPDNIFDTTEAVKVDLAKDGDQMFETHDNKFESIKSLYTRLEGQLL